MIEEEVKEIGAIYRNIIPLEMTAEDNDKFQSAVDCHICNKSCVTTKQLRLTKNQLINLVCLPNIKIPQNLT